MFYKVKVLDAQGNLKKVISSKKLSEKFWKTWEEGQTNPLDVESYGLEDTPEFYGAIRSPKMGDTPQ